jgi:iron complex transport system permease protein
MSQLSAPLDTAARRLRLSLRAPRECPGCLLALGLLTLLLSLALAASQGAMALQWADLLALPRLWQQTAAEQGLDPSLAGAQVAWHIRAPRLLMAMLAGAALGLGGALVQGLFRNPLADPGLIGVSAGAALGAACAIVLGWQVWGLHAGPASLMACAFLGGLLVTVLVWHLARQGGEVQVSQLLLVGLALNAMAGAALGLLTHFADDNQLRSLSFWLLGSLGQSQWPAALLCAGPVLCSLLGAPRLARALNALALGEAQAQLMGVNVHATQRLCVGWCALAVGAVTALVGMVGFVGLLAPHAVRLLAGPDHRLVLPGSALLGASLVLLADAGARTLVAPAELPLGVLTGLLGAPAFLWMLRQRQHRHST